MIIDLTAHETGGPERQLSMTIDLESGLHFPLETADRIEVDRVLATTNDSQPLSGRQIGIRLPVNSGDVHRAMGAMLNDNVMYYYLKLLCTSNLQYNAEHIAPNYAPSVYTQVPTPLGDAVITREGLHHRLRNHELFTSDVLFSPIITGGHITVVIADISPGAPRLRVACLNGGVAC
jgi:hypothetical protein